MKKKQSGGQIIGSLRERSARSSDGLCAESPPILSDAETTLLRDGGLSLEAIASPDPLAATSEELAALIKTSFTTAQAAARLGVHVSRIRQMLAAGTLYGFQVDGRWYIPCQQFTETELIPHLGMVLAVLDRTLHPVAVCRWLSLPDPDLEKGGIALSPLAWLRAGHDPNPVCLLAADM